MQSQRAPTRLETFQRGLRGWRWHLLSVLVAFSLGAGLTWNFKTEVFHLLLAPAGGQLSGTGKPIFTGPTDMFGLLIDTAIKGGLLAAFPVLMYNVYALVLRPFLPNHWKRTLFLFTVLITLFYLAGLAFCYFVLLPTGLRYLLSFGTEIATPMIEITKYMEVVLAMLFWLGVVFELPIIMLLLAKLRLVSHKGFAKVRKYVPVAAFVLGAIITPTFDAVNSTLVAVPLIALYEVGVFLAYLARPKVAKG